MRGARFSLFVFVARVRNTSTITYHEHDYPRDDRSATKQMSLFHRPDQEVKNVRCY